MPKLCHYFLANIVRPLFSLNRIAWFLFDYYIRELMAQWLEILTALLDYLNLFIGIV